MGGREKEILPLIIVRNRYLVLENEATLGELWTHEAIEEIKKLLRDIGCIDRAKKLRGNSNEWSQMMALLNPLVILDTYFFKWDKHEFVLRFPGIVQYIKTIRLMEDEEWEAVQRSGLEQQVLYGLTNLARGKDRVEGQVRMERHTKNKDVFQPLNRVIRKLDPSKYPTDQSLIATGGLVCGIRFAPNKNGDRRRRKEERTLQELLAIDPAVIDAWPVDLPHIIIVDPDSLYLVLINEHTLSPLWTEAAKDKIRRLLRDIGPINKIKKMDENLWSKMAALTNPLVMIETLLNQYSAKDFDVRFLGVIECIQTIRKTNMEEWKGEPFKRNFRDVLVKCKKLAPRVNGQVRIKFALENDKVHKQVNVVLRLFDFDKFPTDEFLRDNNDVVFNGIPFKTSYRASDLQVAAIDPATGISSLQQQQRTVVVPTTAARNTRNTSTRRTSAASDYRLGRNGTTIQSSIGRPRRSNAGNTVASNPGGTATNSRNALSALPIEHSNSRSDRTLMDEVRELGYTCRVGAVTTVVTNAWGTPSPVRRISNHNESSANNNNNSSGSGRGTGNDNQQEQLTDDSNIVQLPAAAATPAASNNGPTLVENADGDDTISEDLVNRTQNSPTSSTNEQETEGTHPGGDRNIVQIPAVATATRAMKARAARFAHDINRDMTDLLTNLDQEKSDLVKTNQRLNTTIQEKKAEASNLTERVASLETTIHQGTQNIDALRAEVGILTARSAASERDLDASRRIIAGLQQTNEGIRADLTASEKINRQRDAELDSSRRSVAELGEYFERHEETIIDLTRERANLQGVVNHLTTRVAEFVASEANHNATIRQRTTDLARRDETIHEQEVSINTLTGENGNLQGTIRNLRGDVSTFEQTIQTNATRHEEAITRREETIHVQEVALATLQGAHTQLQQTHDAMKIVIRDAVAQDNTQENNNNQG